ncbi:uncharacterized protein LOC123548798 [Mercenaria mercenaria]|uniref:uncharacterized protein LOC123548798 n=1 Tax=Mercenaria mercenaria TaxID=6596 RepID=UPI001E1E097C|nr:uncharacterized protein LOC123548798 [Mercenaria mercenaria]
METGFYVILLFLIFLKLMIWLCVFYSRARRRQIIAQRGLIIVQGDVTADPGRDRDVIINREHLPGFSSGGLDNPMVVTNPPSYEEVQRTKNMEEKPPSYDQAVGGNVFQQVNNNVSEQPPQYSMDAPPVQQTTTESNSNA